MFIDGAPPPAIHGEAPDGYVRNEAGLWVPRERTLQARQRYHYQTPPYFFSKAPFPVIQTTRTTAISTNETSHVHNLPLGIRGSDLLILLFSTIDATISWPGGWNEVFNILSSSTTRHACAYRYADETEGSTVTVTTNNARQSTSMVYRIYNATGAPEATTATGNDLTPDPPNLTPSWGSKKTLWIASFGCQANAVLNSHPTNYIDGLSVASAGGAATDRTRSASSRRDLEATSENPGTFQLGGVTNRIWVAATIAVQPRT